MDSHHQTALISMNFARDWTKYDYTDETRLEVMKRKLSKAIGHLRNKIEYNQQIVEVLQKELRVQVEKFRTDYPICMSPEKERTLRTVFVYNIGSKADTDELKWHFGLCGTVKDVILFNEHKWSGVAYVEFEDEIYANIALCMTGSLFMGQRIQVFPRNMTIELNVMQALTKFWGQHLESQFLNVSFIKRLLRLTNEMTCHLHEIFGLYNETENCQVSDGSQTIFDLFRKSKSSLSRIDKYKNSI